MDKLTIIEKKAIIGLISCFKVMNISAQLRDQNKSAGAWLVMGAEIQKISGLLDFISRKNKASKEFVKSQLDLPVLPGKEGVKEYTG